MTQENVKRTGMTSVGGGEFVIKFNRNGYYVVDVEGCPGGKPEICNELFTGLGFALAAVSRYMHDNHDKLMKQKRIEEIAGPKPRLKKEGVRD